MAHSKHWMLPRRLRLILVGWLLRCSASRRIYPTAQVDLADVDAAAVWSLADAIPVGGTAAVALIEHVWADPLSAAIQRAGGSLLEETWLPRPEVELLDTLMARQDR